MKPELIVILVLCVLQEKIFPQYSSQSSLQFESSFLNLPLPANGLAHFHYVAPKQYEAGEEPLKRTEDYHYLHNGDNLLAAQEILNSDIQGAGWLKNFDFGKFISAVIEVRPDDQRKSKGTFDWNGNLVFWKVLKKKKLSR